MEESAFGIYGIKRREWFAAMAPEPTTHEVTRAAKRLGSGPAEDGDVAVKLRYEWADRMIKEGAK